jgi:23S rRNA (cytidine1920-2'-O)/16S rRNA (cytidine1409-2'-O)-methyltransferase
VVRRGTQTLLRAVRSLQPAVVDPAGLIAGGGVKVDGRINRNPESVIGPGSTVALVEEPVLRGEAKLSAALDAFEIDPAGRVALDVGAAAGGFTRVLLARGARLVYAVDAGHGQLTGALRQDRRVVNLEATNLGALSTRVVPEPIELFTLDLSYLSLANAVPQLDAVDQARSVDLVALVKPMFELHLPTPPNSPEELQEALSRAKDGISAAGWEVVHSIDSPVTGSRGAIEFLVHARRVSS